MTRTKDRAMKVRLKACAGCSLCAESCFLFMSNGKDPRYIPSYKVLNSLGRLYRKKGGAGKAELLEMEKLLWRNCVLCGRCSCPMGIDIPAMLAYARAALRSRGYDGMGGYHPELP